MYSANIKQYYKVIDMFLLYLYTFYIYRIYILDIKHYITIYITECRFQNK